MLRRTFLNRSCLACAGISLAGLSVSSCAQSVPVYWLKITGNTIKVPVVSFEDSDITLVRDDKAAYDILLVKRSPLQYDAVYMRCSHGAYALGTSPDGLMCPTHGSLFDYDGTVRTGPATEPLLLFPTELDNNQGLITINIQALKI